MDTGMDQIRLRKEREVRKAIRNAMWKDFDQFPSVWVARDDDDSLWLYNEKPQKAFGLFTSSGEMMSIDNSHYPEITYENSPIKIRLIFIDA
jgi:hypothetical protein